MNHGASSLDCQEVIPERYRLRESEEPHADGRKVMAQIAGADWRSCMKRTRKRTLTRSLRTSPTTYVNSTCFAKKQINPAPMKTIKSNSYGKEDRPHRAD